MSTPQQAHDSTLAAPAAQAILRWALIAFAAVTIIGWVAIGSRNATGYIDKLIEVASIVLLFIEGRR